MTWSDQEVGSILANYADVIEGGNSYRGTGTAYKGIPGTDSIHDELPLEITASGDGTTTTVVDSSRAWSESDRWSRADMAPFFLVCSSATNAVNEGVGRKISAWTLSTTTFTVAAFDAATKSGDVFDLREGFKQIQDGIDIEGDDEVPEGFGRVFQLDVDPGEPDGVYGRGIERYRGELILRVRFLKRYRTNTSRKRVFSNVLRLHTLIPNPNHLDGSYCRALFTQTGPTPIVDDAHKVVFEDRFTMIYALNTEFA